MTEIFLNFVKDILNSTFEQFDLSLQEMFDKILHVERIMEQVIAADTVAALYSFVYKFALCLIILKFLARGFQVYILWRDGDADNSPQDMLIGMAQATTIMICFPWLYDVMVNIALWFMNGITQHLTIEDGSVLRTLLQLLTGWGIVLILILLIYVIMSMVLYVKLLGRGIELLIMRIALPIGCLGLLDSDYGIFKSFMQTFYKTMFTCIIQIALFSLSLRLVILGSFSTMVLAISILMAAFRVPTLMQNLLIPTSAGGGFMNKIYPAAQLTRMVTSLFKR